MEVQDGTSGMASDAKYNWEGILYIHITASRELVSGNIPYYDAFEKTSFGGLPYITVKRETAGDPIKITTTGPIYSGGSFLFMTV